MKYRMNILRPVLPFMILAAAAVIQGCGLCGRPGDRELAESHFRKGLGLEKDSLYSLAEQSYKKAVEADPQFRNAHFQLGNLYDKLGILQKAKAAYEQAIQIDENDAESFNNLGNIYGQMNNLPEAMNHYMKAISIQDSLPSAHYNLGQSYLLKQDFQNAENHLKLAYDYSSGEMKYAESLGLYYISQNKLNEAVGIFTESISKKKVKPSLYLHLSTAYRKLNQFDNAITHLETYISLIQGQQEKTIALQRLRELRRESHAYRSAELRKKVSKSDKNILH